MTYHYFTFNSSVIKNNIGSFFVKIFINNKLETCCLS